MSYFVVATRFGNSVGRIAIPYHGEGVATVPRTLSAPICAGSLCSTHGVHEQVLDDVEDDALDGALLITVSVFHYVSQVHDTQ